MSGRDLAKAIGRGPTYVRERINDEKEWALGDIERMCNLWALTPTQLIEGAPRVADIPPTDATPALAGAGDGAGDAAREARRRELAETAARESRLEEETLRRLEADPLSLAAYHDPHKHDPSPTTSRDDTQLSGRPE